MSTTIEDYTIKCWNDCRMEGCPSHKVKLQYNNTSNALTYEKDGEILFGMDSDELEAFIQSVARLRHYIEIERIFKSVERNND